MTIKELRKTKGKDLYNFLLEEYNNFIEDMKEITRVRYTKTPYLFGLLEKKKNFNYGQIDNPKSIFFKNCNGYYNYDKIIGSYVNFTYSDYEYDLEEVLNKVGSFYFNGGTVLINEDFNILMRDFIIENKLTSDATRNDYLDTSIVKEINNGI